MPLKKKVTIVDDTLRHNLCVKVSAEMRSDFAKRGRPIPPRVSHLPARDRHGHTVMQEVRAIRTFEGVHLENVMKRARRWIRRQRRCGTDGKMPGHIALAMAAFRKADPAGFARALEGSET